MRMVQGLVDSVQTLEPNQWRIKLPAAFILIAFTTYISNIFSYFRTKYSDEDGREPPVIPYWLPGLGNTIPFVRDTKGFIAKTL